VNDFFRYAAFGVIAFSTLSLCHFVSPFLIPVIVVTIGLAIALQLKSRDSWLEWMSVLVVSGLFSVHRWAWGSVAGIALVSILSARRWWDSRFGYRTYCTTVYLSKRRGIEQIIRAARSFNIQFSTHDYHRDPKIVFRMTYDARPITNHLFLKTLICTPLVQKIVRHRAEQAL